MAPKKTWENISKQFSNSNEESPVRYRRKPTGEEAIGLVANFLFKTRGYRSVITNRSALMMGLKNAFTGDNAALGSIFEDEAVVIPNPQIPYRLKDVDFFEHDESKVGLLKDILTKGGAFTSLRFRTANVPGVSPKGKKGIDIEIDYTIIDPDHHKVYLVELKKGLGAAQPGDALQLVRASEVIDYHYKKVHNTHPEFQFFFVAGNALDPTDIQFFTNSRLEDFELLTAQGFSQLIGINYIKMNKIMKLRPKEQFAYAKTLIALNDILQSHPEQNRIHYISNLMNSMTENQKRRIPPWMSKAATNRVARLKDLDILGPLIFKKRELSKYLKGKNGTPGQRTKALEQWMWCVRALSQNSMIKKHKRDKYKLIIEKTPGISFDPPPGFIDPETVKPVKNRPGVVRANLSEWIRLRAEQLGPVRYQVYKVNSNNWRLASANRQAVTEGQQLAQLRNSLTNILKGTTENMSLRANKSPSRKLGLWIDRMKSIKWTPQIRHTPKFRQLQATANAIAENIRKARTAENTKPANSYENRIAKAQNSNQLTNLVKSINSNNKITPNRKKTLKTMIVKKNANLTAALLPARQRQAGPSKKTVNTGKVNNIAYMTNENLRQRVSKLMKNKPGKVPLKTVTAQTPRRNLVNAFRSLQI